MQEQVLVCYAYLNIHVLDEMLPCPRIWVNCLGMGVILRLSPTLTLHTIRDIIEYYSSFLKTSIIKVYLFICNSASLTHWRINYACVTHYLARLWQMRNTFQPFVPRIRGQGDSNKHNRLILASFKHIFHHLRQRIYISVGGVLCVKNGPRMVVKYKEY